MRRQYVYTVTMHFDRWDHYRIALAATLPIAKRLAQADHTALDLPDVAPTLKWDARQSAIKGQPLQRYWVAPVNAYGREYRIHKNEVITS